MTTATREIVERLAREAGFTPSEFGLSPRLVGDLARFWSLAMEHAAGICDERFFLRASEGLPREASAARSLAAAIREAGK